MSSAPITTHSSTQPRTRRGRSSWKALKPGVEWEFEQFVLGRDLSRNAVTRLLVQRAESGGWELDRLRLSPDGTRRVQLRRKIIRQRPEFLYLAI